MRVVSSLSLNLEAHPLTTRRVHLAMIVCAACDTDNDGVCVPEDCDDADATIPSITSCP